MSRSKWQLLDNFRDLTISHHTGTKSRGWKENYFQSAHIGQEFVIQDSDIAEKWARKLIGKNEILK